MKYLTDTELPDGIGGQLLRKLAAYSNARNEGMHYFHRPVTDLMWHPGDCFTTEEEKQELIVKLNGLFPFFKEVSLKEEDTLEILPPGVGPQNHSDLKGLFKRFAKEKRIVFHIRRGNIVPDQNLNPRYTPDWVYKGLFRELEKVIYDFGLDSHEIVILTDGPINKEEYVEVPDTPLWTKQKGMSVVDGVAKLTPFNTDVLNPNLEYTIINNICSYDAITMMLGADWLFPSYSAFSNMVALAGHYNAVVNTRQIPGGQARGFYLDTVNTGMLYIDDKVYSLK